MASFVNGCVFTATSSGTGSFVVSAAVTGWQTPAQAGASNGATYRYRAYSADNTQWEIGSGVYTTGTVTLTRVLIEASSNGGSATNFTLPPVVALTMFDEDIVPFASPTFTGVPASTTAAVDTNTTQIATTAFVLAQSASATPLGNMATAVVGTSTRYARADHVHPGREVLTANRTYYVRTDGSDSNDGLANTAGGAFLTIQKAINIVAALDISIFNVTIQVGTGTYTSGFAVNGAWVGSGTVELVGDNTTPANVVISTTSSNAAVVSSYGRLSVRGFKVQAATSGIGVAAQNGGVLTINGNMNYGACATAQIYAERAGVITIASSYTISGSSPSHAHALSFGYIFNVTNTITLTGTPAFSSGFANASRFGLIEFASNTFSGSATGSRYVATSNGAVNTFGGGASYLPGNAVGSATSPGWYA